MKSRFIALALSVLSGMTISTYATALMLRGGPWCGQWISEKDKTQEVANKFWLLGFLSGLVVGDGKDFIKGTDSESLYLWMDNYCRANPLEHVSSGGWELSRTLITQKRL